MHPSDNQDHQLPQVNSSDDTGGSNLVTPQNVPQDDLSKTQPSVNQPVSNDDNQLTVGLNEMSAEDLELIEKEWVEKAKEIVSRTQGDPYKQNIELNRVRAEYIKKRYNKDVRTDG